MEYTVATVIYDRHFFRLFFVIFQVEEHIVSLSFAKEQSKKSEAHFHGGYRILDTAPFEIIIILLPLPIIIAVVYNS